MGIGRPTKPLNVTSEEREKLAMLARRPKTAQAMAMRASIVLGCDEGLSNGTVAKSLRITGATVCKWRERFRVNRLEGLLDEPRPGAPRSVTDKQVEAVVTKTLESMPANSTHWSTRLMAKKAGLSQTAVVRIWHAFGLQPHRVENFKFSKDPQFVEKVRDIVGLYMNPPDRAIVLCVDEKSQVQALNRTQPILPAGAWRAREAIARLRTARSDLVVRRHGRGERRDDQQLLSPAPPPGIPAISERCRCQPSPWG